MPQVQALPAAALLLANAARGGSRATADLLSTLCVWAPGSAAQGLELLAGPSGKEPLVRSYAIKCLFNENPEKV